MFENMSAFYTGVLIFLVVAVLSGIFAEPLNSAMVEVERQGSGHNDNH